MGRSQLDRPAELAASTKGSPGKGSDVDARDAGVDSGEASTKGSPGKGSDVTLDEAVRHRL